MVNLLPGVFQEIPQDLVGLSLGREHVAVRLDIQPGLPGAGGHFVFNGLMGHRVVGGVWDRQVPAQGQAQAGGLFLQGFQGLVQPGFGSAQGERF